MHRENWFMVLPVALTFGGKQVAYTTVYADGPTTSICVEVAQQTKQS